MAKIRIYEITKELIAKGVDVDNKKVISFLEEKGITGKTQSSSVEDAEADLVRSHFSGRDRTESRIGAEEKSEAVKKPVSGDKPAQVEKQTAGKAAADKGAMAKPVSGAKGAVEKKPAQQTGESAEQGGPVKKKKRPNIIFAINNGNKGARQVGQIGGTRQVGHINRGRIEDPAQHRGIIKPSVKPSPAPEVNIIRPNAQTPVKKQAEQHKGTVEAPVKPALEPVKPAFEPVKQEVPEAAGTAQGSLSNTNTAEPKKAAAQGRNINAGNNKNTQENTNSAPYTQNRNGNQGGSRGAGNFGNSRNGSYGNARPQGKTSNQGGPKEFAGGDQRKGQDRHKGEGDRRRQNEAKRRRDRELVVDEEKERKRQNPHGFKKPVAVQKAPEEEIKVITIPDTLTIKELADHMRMQPSVIIKKLFLTGQIVTVNSEISYEEAENIAMEYDILCEHEQTVDVIAELLKEDEEDESTMDKRPPVVCVMGHVDHGKTSLLDTIRKSHVTEKEAGGITQAIGAYTVSLAGRKITFLDTPGHEAFTAMRMRGANATDIVILVVAADDGVMPQTVEAINHAKAANVEIIVAINKIDKPSANPDRVKQELSEYELIPEEWGGSTIFVPVSAKTGTGVDDLLEMITLTADVMELKANAHRKARGMVIEAELDKGRGPVATVLVQKGTLHVGDFVACGPCHGKVRAMIDDKGKRVKEAGPSIPVEILGLDDVPAAGEIFVSPDSEKEAQSFANTYKEQHKKELLSETKKKSMTLDDLYEQIQEGDLKEFNVIIKADVQGSVEALKSSLLKLTNEEVAVKVIHGGVGAISESDVMLASASNAIIIGFNVRPDSTAKAKAETENVEINLYRIIYQAIEDVESAMKGMLAPVYEEKIIGHGEIRQIFKASGIGNIAGSYVTDGIVEKGCSVRITRGKDEIFDGPLSSLKRFKDDVKEVKEGYECGLTFDGFDAVEEGDLLEFHKQVEVERK